ncbi:ketol-acid reductoisomerase [Patescibacteria group bacterium]|nr:ketol-acid reductoisomerase [Patescibacteria group bacterium]
MVKIYREKEADLSLIKDRVVAVIGYGNQGRSQALNMRDSGLKVIVGSVKDESWGRAKKDEFEVMSIPQAAEKANIIFVLLPDEVVPEIFDKDIYPHLKVKDVLVLASGYNIYYRYLRVPEFVDLVLLAPRMIGKAVRDLYISGKGAPSLIGVGQDFSGKAKQIVLALAKGIGSTKIGAIESSFEEETKIDLLGGQIRGTCLIFMRRLAFEIMVESGCSPEVAALELYASGEDVETFRAAAEQGLWAQLKLHSQTSQYGQLTRGPRIANEQMKKIFRKMMQDIETGAFAKEWTLEQQSGKSVLGRLWSLGLSHPLIEAENRVFKLLGKR